MLPGASPSGTFRPPGDKSITHRGLLLGAMAEGTTLLLGANRGEDCRALEGALSALGVAITEEGEALRIEGSGGRLRPPGGTLHLGNAGTGLRLLAGLLASQRFDARLDGDDSLRRRPMGRIVEPLRRMGALVEGREGGRFPPLFIRGGPLRGIDWRTEVASAQVKSSILLAGLRAEGWTSVTEPALSRDHTERMIPYMGGKLLREGLTVRVEGGTSLRGRRIRVGGDPSAAAFPLAMALLSPEGRVTAEGILANGTRTAFLDVLERMGARILREPEEGGAEEGAEESIRVTAEGGGALRGTVIGGDEIPRLIDEIPLLAVVGARSSGVFTVRDARELRRKESDRIAATVRLLRAFGAEAEERPDGFTVRGELSLRGTRVESGGDHRIAMAAVAAGLAAAGETIVEGSACAGVSFPGFMETLAALGLGGSITEEERCEG
ncbi:MAG: 3-phosphoshikimate 1-carboxyvinyltransferase [Candidatus Eisenbacteria bacterium]|nr:3-phosphoshikimate 1-carboxyvinyltransferase [Candidatus Eisenbacteria bacterium]